MPLQEKKSVIRERKEKEKRMKGERKQRKKGGKEESNEEEQERGGEHIDSLRTDIGWAQSDGNRSLRLLKENHNG